MLDHRAPGVYFEWVDPRPPTVELVRTDIAGFVGIAERGPLHQPVRVESWTQFVSTFGGHIAQGYLAYAVEGFFANGGRTCWVVRAADAQGIRTATAELPDGSGAPTVRLTASSPGFWGRRLVVAVLHSTPDRFTLRIRLLPGGGDQSGLAPVVIQELWRDLRTDPADPRHVVKVLNDPRSGSRLVVASSIAPAGRQPAATPREIRLGETQPADGWDGLVSLQPAHLSGIGAPVDAIWGLAALARVDEVGIVAIPDIMPVPYVQSHTASIPARCDVLAEPEEMPAAPPAGFAIATEVPASRDAGQVEELQRALVAHCEELRDRVAILDTRLADTTPEAALALRAPFDTKYAALYYPWLRVPDPLRLTGLLRTVPPSGHLAGICARTDLTVGVHEPPANEIVAGARDLLVQTDEIAHGDLNADAVNVIRSFSGRGIRVAGARTLSREIDWRYLNVRRLMIAIEESIDQGTQWTVFEPNNPERWRDVQRIARTFLDDLWRRGMLDGATPEEAYDVVCDASTNPPAETAIGRLTCRIAVRPPWPAEQVIVLIGKTEGTGVREPGGGSNA